MGNPEDAELVERVAENGYRVLGDGEEWEE